MAGHSASPDRFPATHTSPRPTESLYILGMNRTDMDAVLWDLDPEELPGAIRLLAALEKAGCAPKQRELILFQGSRRPAPGDHDGRWLVRPLRDGGDRS